MSNYCKKCVYPINAVALNLDDEGVCSACRSHEQEEQLTKDQWDKRKQKFEETISELNKDNDPKVFVLWGNNAIKKELLITNPHHLVLSSSHPSPLSARHSFFGSKVFTKINDFLRKNSREIIDFKII